MEIGVRGDSKELTRTKEKGKRRKSTLKERNDRNTISIPHPNNILPSTRVKCLISWHVDNSMGVSNSWSTLTFVKVKMAECFSIKDLGPVMKYLRVEYEHSRGTWELWIHQKEYITFLLGEYNLTACNPVVLPIDPNHLLGLPNATFPKVPNLRQSYMKLIGKLIYLSINT